VQPEALSKAYGRLVNARTELLLDWPFFGYVALNLELRLDPGCKTVWTDGVTLGANPEYVNALSRLELIEAIAHLVLKLVACHHLRQGSREHSLWQRATDYAIAPLLLDSVYRGQADRMPKGMYEARFRGLSAEWIYHLLEKESRTSPTPGLAEGEMGEGGAGRSGADQCVGDGGGGEPDEGDAAVATGEQPAVDPARRPEVRGEVRPLPAGRNRDAHKGELNATLAEAAMAARGRGLLPGQVEVAVEKQLESKIDWRAALRIAVSSGHSNPDYQMHRPNRRMLALGTYLPSLTGQGFGLLAQAVDTSASVMAYGLFDTVMAEVTAICEEIRPQRMLLLECDACIQRVQELFEFDEVKPNFQGGGGTSYEPVFHWIEESGENPEALLYFTDLECTFPQKEPPYPVIWVAPEGRNVKPPFGQLIEVPF